jgi:HPt (histidine-containing phosphotransfer) domain-containing protein
MADTSEDFAVYRFVQELFEDLTLTLPSLGCRFEGTATANSLTVSGRAHALKNKLFLLFADLASASPSLTVRFRPSVRGDQLVLGFFCTPFDTAAVQMLPAWDPSGLEAFQSDEGSGFRLSLPAGRPLDVGPPVNWHQLAQLYGGAVNGQQVLDHFVVRCRTLLPDLEAAIRGDDGPGVLRVAHTLKGSARGATAQALAEAALQLEMLGRSGSLTGADDLYKALLVTYDEFIHWVQEGQLS